MKAPFEYARTALEGTAIRDQTSGCGSSTKWLLWIRVHRLFQWKRGRTRSCFPLYWSSALTLAKSWKWRIKPHVWKRLWNSPRVTHSSCPPQFAASGIVRVFISKAVCVNCGWSPTANAVICRVRLRNTPLSPRVACHNPPSNSGKCDARCRQHHQDRVLCVLQ